MRQTATIYIMTHKPFTGPDTACYKPLRVGSALGEDFGYLRDDTGVEISVRNPYYSELTGHYWVWKNDKESDYVGCVHYRRYLLDDNGRLYTGETIARTLETYDFITTKLLTLEHSYYEAFDDRHSSRDLDILGGVIREYRPEYYETYERLVHGCRTYFGNMYIMPKKLYDAYMEFLFPLLFETEKRVDMTGYDGYQKRLFGFLSELLLYVWTSFHGLKVKESMVGMFSEKAETKELKEALAGFFHKKDVAGAKNCFLEYYRKRPDILMEVSDLNGECRLAMQAISSMEWEQETCGKNRLDETTDFQEIIGIYRRLNELARAYGRNAETLEQLLKLSLEKEEREWIDDCRISETEYQIARKVTDTD